MKALELTTYALRSSSKHVRTPSSTVDGKNSAHLEGTDLSQEKKRHVQNFKHEIQIDKYLQATQEVRKIRRTPFLISTKL